MSKKANIIITADSKGVDKAVSKANSSLDKLGKKTGSTSKAMGGLSVAGVALGSAIGGLCVKAFQALAERMDDAVSRLDTLNNFPKVMSNLGIETEKSQKIIQVLSDKLQDVPTRLDDAVGSVQRFTSANGNLEASTAIYLALNDALMAGGTSASLQAEAMEQLSQAYGKGKPDAMEWRKMLEAMPAQLKQVANSMGYTSTSIGGDFYEAIQTGKVSMNEFLAQFVKLDNDMNRADGFPSFHDQALNATNGVQTSIANLKNAITRGLADIMNAIGQSNIAGFFNSIRNAINSATKYVVAFVKIVMLAVSYLNAFFGGGGSVASGLTKATAEASKNMGGVASGAGDTSSSLKNATGQAKKLAQQLAGFDEMNVLKEQDSGGSGSGGGASDPTAGLGSIDLSGITGALDGVGNKTDEIYGKMLNMVKGINFNKWHKSLREFKKGFTNTFAILDGVAQMTWDNIFKSLAKHIAENTLPDFIEGIGQAMQRLDPSTWLSGFDTFSQGVASAFKGILDFVTPVATAVANFISALANWTIPPALSILGAIFEVIGNVLTGIGEGFTYVWTEEIEPALTAFGEFLQPIIEKIQGIFGAIQQCTPLMEFFKTLGQMIGIVVGGAFTLIVDAIMLVVGAIGIAIDFFIEMGTWAGNVILNIIDFFTNLGKNIDDIFTGIGKFVSDVWNGIWDALVKVFTPIGEFFSGLFEGVKNVFNGAWNALKTGAQNAWNAIKNIFSTVASFFGTIFTNAWNSVKAVFSTGGKIFMGIVDGIANAFKQIVNAIIGGINKVVAVPFNAINGMLNRIRGIDIAGIKPFEWIGTISVPQIPKLAKGGIVDEATLAMVGEQGKEAVVPLENNTEWIDQLAEQLRDDGNQNITIMIGDETIVDTIVDKINARTTLNNRSVIKL